MVPLSATAPQPIEPWHHQLSPESLPMPFRSKATWAKCDMVTTVSLERLDRVLAGRDAAGKRQYVAHNVNAADLIVRIEAVGIKVGNLLFIRGTKRQL